VQHRLVSWFDSPIKLECLKATLRDSLKAFLNGRNRDFDEKYHPIACLNDYPNIDIFNSSFIASQK